MKFRPTIPPSSIVLTYSPSIEAYAVCGFARHGGRPVIETGEGWLYLLESGSKRAEETGCEFFVSDEAVSRITKGEG